MTTADRARAPRPHRPHPPAAAAGALVAALVLVAVAALASACGQSTAPPAAPASTPAAPASATPVAGSRPLAGSAREAAAEYWRLVDADDLAGALAASVPGTPTDLTAVPDDIEHVRLVSARAPRTLADGSVELEVTVDVQPVAGPTPWGEPGERTLFMRFQRAEDGWLLEEWGTGP